MDIIRYLYKSIISIRCQLPDVDLGVSIHLIKPILRKYMERVEIALNIPGHAAVTACQIERTFRADVLERKGSDGQR